jgi:DNA-binding NtrC family response regulator
VRRPWRRSSDLPLPSPADATTIVIRDIATLSLSFQQAWLARLNAPHARHQQIITTSSIAVFPLVARGVFLEELYYRLNTVLLDVRKSGSGE